MQKRISRSSAKLVSTPLNKNKRAQRPGARFKHEQPPEKFTYALSAHTAERRKDGWYIAKTVPSFNGEKPKWTGPFETIENACLSIARHLSVELADRHTRSIESHKLDRKHPLFGLKLTTRLRAR